jgi:Na+-transporting NADH:ubiquinone oxidoreductase subunit NqrB
LPSRKSSKPKKGDKPESKKPGPKKEPFKDQVAQTAVQTLVVYLLWTAIFAVASFALSFVKLAGLVDLVILFFFLRDIEDLPEKAPRLSPMIKRMVQGGVNFGISYLFGDPFGMLGSGLLLLFLGLYLFQAFGNWLDKMLKRFDKWLSKMGLQ